MREEKQAMKPQRLIENCNFIRILDELHFWFILNFNFTFEQKYCGFMTNQLIKSFFFILSSMLRIQLRYKLKNHLQCKSMNCNLPSISIRVRIFHLQMFKILFLKRVIKTKRFLQTLRLNRVISQVIQILFPHIQFSINPIQLPHKSPISFQTKDISATEEFLNCRTISLLSE